MYEFFSKRPEPIESSIINAWEPSRVHKKVFTTDETKRLINIFKKAPKTSNMTVQNKMFDDYLNSNVEEEKVKRPRKGEDATACSAPVCWDEGSKEILDPVVRKCVGDYKIVGGTFNLLVGPYRLHTDSGRLPETKIFKQIIIPLHWDYKLDVYSMLYDQRWTGCQARFQRGIITKSDESFNNATHMTVKNYEKSDIHNLTHKPFDWDDYGKYCTHINYESLWGFSIELAAKWEPQSLIAYDRCVIHSSDHFQSLNNKLFIALVTEQAE